jgi:hypothetical protein
LDSKCLDLGDDFDSALQQAQAASLITVILVSEHTRRAYYQREEIASAIAMARTESHRVVPIFVAPATPQSTAVPYGLRLKHGLIADGKRNVAHLAESLRGLLEKVSDGRGSLGDQALKRQSGKPGSRLRDRRPRKQPSRREDKSSREDKVGLAITIKGDISGFTKKDEERLLERIGQVLRPGESVQLICIEEGSVRVKVKLSRPAARRLQLAIKAGELRDLSVLSARLTTGRPKASPHPAAAKETTHTSLARKNAHLAAPKKAAPKKAPAVKLTDHQKKLLNDVAALKVSGVIGTKGTAKMLAALLEKKLIKKGNKDKEYFRYQITKAGEKQISQRKARSSATKSPRPERSK